MTDTPRPWQPVNQTDLWGDGDELEYRNSGEGDADFCGECGGECDGHRTRWYWWVDGPEWVECGEWSLMTEANARLIAAAPDLLRVLERAYGYVHQAPLEGALDMAAEMRSAIAKARGDS